MGQVMKKIKHTSNPEESKNPLCLYPYGDDDYGIRSNGINKQFIRFFCGHYQCFGVDTTGKIYSWGLNDYGQLGKGTVDDYSDKSSYNKSGFIDNYSCINAKNSILFKVNIRKISCGHGFSALLTEDLEVYTFGLGNEGQLGYPLKFLDSFIVNNTQKCQLTPRKIDFFSQNNIKIVNIECGKNFLISIDNYGRHYGNGDNSLCQLSLDTYYKYYENPTQINTIGYHISKLKCGWTSVISLSDDGDVYIWGNPFYDYDKNFPNLSQPTKIENLGKTLDIACGFHHFLSLSVKNSSEGPELFTWGANDYYQLGYSTKTPFTLEPENVNLLEFPGQKIAVYAGSYHSICQLEDKTLISFGHNYNQEIGDYADKTINRPVEFNHKIESVLKNKYVECGNGFTFVISTDKEIVKPSVCLKDKNKSKITEIQLMMESHEVNHS